MALGVRASVDTVDQSGGGVNNCVLDLPSGVVDGDLLFVVIQNANVGVSTAPSSEWRLLARLAVTIHTLDIWWKIASSEGATLTWTGTQNIWLGAIFAVTGFDVREPLESARSGSGSDASCEAPDVISNFTDSGSFVFYVTDTSQTSLSLPTNYTNITTFGSNGDIMRLAWRQLSASGATGQITSTANTTGGWSAHHVLVTTSGTPVQKQFPVKK
jgi:hypothetical protein